MGDTLDIMRSQHNSSQTHQWIIRPCYWDKVSHLLGSPSPYSAPTARWPLYTSSVCADLVCWETSRLQTVRWGCADYNGLVHLSHIHSDGYIYPSHRPTTPDPAWLWQAMGTSSSAPDIKEVCVCLYMLMYLHVSVYLSVCVTCSWIITEDAATVFISLIVVWFHCFAWLQLTRAVNQWRWNTCSREGVAAISTFSWIEQSRHQNKLIGRAFDYHGAVIYFYIFFMDVLGWKA